MSEALQIERAIIMARLDRARASMSDTRDPRELSRRHDVYSKLRGKLHDIDQRIKRANAR